MIGGKTMTMRRLLVALAGVCLLAACQDGPRKPAFPTFDARAPFDELDRSKTASKAGSEANDGATEFERAIADSMEEGEGESGDEPKTVKRQQVPLSRSLVSSIPLDFDEWQWSTEGRVTMISYKKAGATQPDALIYVEGFSELIRSFPSMEVRRFQQTVDPELTRSMTLPGLSEAPMRHLSEQTGVDVSRLGDALTRAASHTMGLGLNYTSSEDSFTGWRWIGRNDHDVELRLGRTRGTWSAHARADAEMSGTFSQISGQFADVEGVKERYDDVLANQVGRDDSGWPAWMLVGSAVIGRDSGAHIAIVCKATPRCPVAAELSEFLARLEPASGNTIEALSDPSGRPSLDDFAEQQGLPFAPADQILSPGDIGDELRKALSQ